MLVGSKLVNMLFRGLADFVTALTQSEVVVPHIFESGDEIGEKLTENIKVLTDAVKNTGHLPIVERMTGLKSGYLYIMTVRNVTCKVFDTLLDTTRHIHEQTGITIVVIPPLDFDIVQVTTVDQEAQAKCKHEKLSDWVAFAWDGPRKGGEVRICTNCSKIVEKR